MKKLLPLLPPLILSTPLFADEAAASAKGGSFNPLMLCGALLVLFYFMLWRPEQKRRKRMQEQRTSMKKGDRITAMGIIGTLVKQEEKSVILKMVDGSRIEVLKSAISEVQSAKEEKEAAQEESCSVEGAAAESA